jgi:hypothetical protein
VHPVARHQRRLAREGGARTQSDLDFGALARRESFAAVLTRQLRDIPLADCTLPGLVADPWLKALTTAAAAAPIPIQPSSGMVMLPVRIADAP